ncbi:RNA binding protein [Colletotrichum asianum]
MASAELSKKRKRADDDAATAKKSKSDKKDKKEKKEKKAKAAASTEEDETAAPATDEFIALEESKKDKKERKRKEKEARKAAAAAEEQEEAADVSAMDVDPPADGEKKKKKDKKSKKAKTEEEEEAAAPAAEEVKEEKKSKKEKKDKKKEAKPETNGEEKSKKKDKKSKKTKEEPTASAPAPAAEEQEEEPAEGGKREKYIVFVGNLPYTANKESISAHFSAYNPSAVRCLNKDNNPNVCRGIAFLEFSNGSNMRTCLDKMHHTEFDDGLSPARRINLELSAGGGGKSKFRREKIKSRNVQLDENRVKRMQKEEEYKKQRVSEGGSNTQQDSIHPSRLALMHQ